MNKLLFIAVALLMSGCQSTFGPSALKNTHIPYNQAIADTLKQQMLLNLVRLKYHDEPYYLKVGSVTSSLTFASNIGINSKIDIGSGGNVLSPQLGMSYADKPTISYQPLQGEDFFKSVLMRLPLGKLFVLSATGWDIDYVLGLCVSDINEVGNAVGASGLSPKIAPEYQNFERMLALFKSLKTTGHLKIGPSGKQPGTWGIKFIKTTENQPIIEELMNLLRLPATTQIANIVDVEYIDIEKPADSRTVVIHTRSIANVLSYLSHNIDIPAEHIEQGLVTMTKTADGQLFDWSKTPAGKLFRIQSSDSYPDNAFLAIPYLDYWYYIAGDDLQSKSTFMLITQLFNHQSGRSKSNSPVLTIPVR